MNIFTELERLKKQMEEELAKTVSAFSVCVLMCVCCVCCL